MKPRGGAPKIPKTQTDRAQRHLWWKPSENHSLSLYVEENGRWRKTKDIWEVLLSQDEKDQEDLRSADLLELY